MGLKDIRGEQTFPLGKVLLDLLHEGVLKFIPRFKYFLAKS